ncbi:type I polyketide synthase [Streptomyces sp. NPDC047976]|uniref:type I polyketide synthase n=1 Tax=Streptomyces sp. NPDC047976 TaxID=3155746 RepID=UPI003424B960
MPDRQDVPIAVIGIGCRFPGGAHSPEKLWQLMVEGRDLVGAVPPDRWDAAALSALQHPDDAARYARGCFLEGDIWAWEPAAFSVAPIEGVMADPQHRLITEVAWEAVEHSGIPVASMRGSRTGVYVGMFAPDSLLRSARPVRDWIDGYYIFGNSAGNAPGRISFPMDLRGPAMAIETLCSSGLVAVYQACRALVSGECDMALAGAVLLMSSPETMHYEAKWLTSTRGRCYAFDARADGYVRGEGAGMLLFKRLDDALADGDRVLAVVRGSAVTSDGQTERMTAPSTVMQQEAFRTALSRAGVDARDVGLVEAHGPGTFHGDPIEYVSVNAVYGRGRGRCALGSVKTNIGHSEPTSGVAGLIKAVLAVQRGLIPANLHFGGWNPSIPLDGDSRLFVPTELTSWPVDGVPRLAGVCSYGLAGTNAHVIVEEPPAVRRPAVRAPRREVDEARVFLLSTFSPKALPEAAGRLADWLDAHSSVPLGDVAHSLAVRRTASSERLAVIAATREELTRQLRTFAEGAGAADAVVAGRPVLSDGHPGPVLVFTGQGSQWAGMCQGLLDRDAPFTAVIDRLEPLIAAEAGFSLRRMLSEPSLLRGVDRIQPVLFAVQVALAAVWRSWGVVPAAVVGQSLGEVAAAVVADRLSLEDGVKVICRRARLLRAVTGGAMASVLLDAEAVQADLLARNAALVSIAVHTSPGQVVISGDRAQVEAMVALWQERGESAGLVPVDYASHSPQMDPLTTPVTEALADLAPVAGGTCFYSTVAQDPREGIVPDGAYWAANLREPVRFEQAVAAALQDGHRLFIECTSHPLAVHALHDIAAHHGVKDTVIVGSLRRDAPDEAAMLQSVAAAHCSGATVNWADRYPGNLADVPTATWHRTHHRFDPPYELVAPGLVGASQHSLLGGHVLDPDRAGRHLWQTPISPARVPWLGDHQVAGTPVMAGAGICEMMASAAAEALSSDLISVEDLRLHAALVLDPEPQVTVSAEVTAPGRARITVLSRTGAGQVVHAEATATITGRAPSAVPLQDTASEEWEPLVPGDLYAYFRDRHHVIHGPAFQGLEGVQLHRQADEAVARLRIPDVARASAWMMRIHPALLDSAVQAVLAIWCTHHRLEPGPVVVAGFDRVTLYGKSANAARAARLQLGSADSLSCTANATLTTDTGEVVATIQGLRVSNITPPEQRFTARLAHITHSSQPAPTARGEVGSVLILAEPGTWPDELATTLNGQGIEHRLLKLPGGSLSDPDVPALLSGAAPATVVYAVGQSTPYDPEPVSACNRSRTLAHLMRHLAGTPKPPRLWVASCAAPHSLTTAGMRGILRTAAYEYPALAASLVEADDTNGAKGIAAELLCGDTRTREVRLEGDSRLTAQVSTTPPEPDGPSAGIRADGAYLVTGALGGLGLLTVTDLARQGAGHIVACTRSTPSGDAKRVLDQLRAEGAHVTLVQGDIAEASTIAAAIGAATAGRLPLRGVIHSAGVVEDAVLDNLTPGLFERVWRGKAVGAWNLHQATKDLELDFWVAYSSLASLLGSPGQAAYSAANAFLDDLVAHRRALALPATAIQWGAWAEVGKGQGMAERGFAMISPTDGIDALRRILKAGYTRVAYSPIDLHQWLAPYPDTAASALFTSHTRATGDEDTTILNALHAAGGDAQRRALLNTHIADIVRGILNVPDQHITPTTSMVMLGLDSLNAMRLRQQLQRSLHMAIDPAILWTKPTPAGITDWILQQTG